MKGLTLLLVAMTTATGVAAENHIIAKITDAHRYAGGNPYMKKALAFLQRPDLMALKPAVYEIDGTNCWANICENDLKPIGEECRFEAHRTFIDIQAPLSGPETYGIVDLPEDASQIPPFDVKRDCVLFRAKGKAVTLQPGEFAIFNVPGGAHAPCHSSDGPRRIRKVILKVRAQ